MLFYMSRIADLLSVGENLKASRMSPVLRPLMEVLPALILFPVCLELYRIRKSWSKVSSTCNLRPFLSRHLTLSLVLDTRWCQPHPPLTPHRINPPPDSLLTDNPVFITPPRTLPAWELSTRQDRLNLKMI